MTSKIPRYVIGRGSLTYEVPVVREHDGREEASLSVSSFGWSEALQTALTWSLTYAEKFDARHQPPKPVAFWPEVRYHTSEINQRRMAKRIDSGYVWAEQRSGGAGAWLPVDTVFA